MSSYNMEFFSWCAAGSSDKVWGYFNLGTETRYSFWGRRGGHITFKEHHPAEFRSLVRKGMEKAGKGYKEVSIDMIEKTKPGFTEEFEHKFVMDKMFENFHGQR